MRKIFPATILRLFNSSRINSSTWIRTSSSTSTRFDSLISSTSWRWSKLLLSSRFCQISEYHDRNYRPQSRIYQAHLNGVPPYALLPWATSGKNLETPIFHPGSSSWNAFAYILVTNQKWTTQTMTVFHIRTFIYKTSQDKLGHYLPHHHHLFSLSFLFFQISFLSSFFLIFSPSFLSFSPFLQLSLLVQLPPKKTSSINKFQCRTSFIYIPLPEFFL